ncbi:MAG: hypothetical protein WDM96_01955 [Lacunisphaera sp.]
MPFDRRARKHEPPDSPAIQGSLDGSRAVAKASLKDGADAHARRGGRSQHFVHAFDRDLERLLDNYMLASPHRLQRGLQMRPA